MLISQMIARRAESLECHRRAMLPEQTIESRQVNLSAANRLSRTHVALLEGLNRHHGKGQQVAEPWSIRRARSPADSRPLLLCWPSAALGFATE